MLGVVQIRAIVVAALAGALSAAACAAPPQEDSTALVEPEPLPTDQPVEDAASEPLFVPVEGEPSPSPQGAPTAHSEPAPASITNIPICDEYLALYQRCEEHLRPEIMAGDRRFYRAEAASLQQLASTPEAAGLPDACRNMLDELRVDCPAQHRRPPEPKP